MEITLNTDPKNNPATTTDPPMIAEPVSVGAVEESQTLKDNALSPAREAEAAYREELETWRKEVRQEVEEAVLGFDDWMPEKSPEVKRRMIIRKTIETELDWTPRTTIQYAMARSNLARRMFDGAKVGTDEEMFGKLAEHANKNRDRREFREELTQQAVLSALSGWSKYDASWGTAAKENEMYQENPAEASRFFREARQRALDRYDEILPDVRRLNKAVEQGEISYSMIFDLVQDRDDEELGMLAEALGTIERIADLNEGEESLLGNLKEQGGRDLDNLGGKAWRGAIDLAVEALGFGADSQMRNSPEARAQVDAVKQGETVRERAEGFLAEIRRFRDSRNPINFLSDEDSGWRTVERGFYATPGVGVTIGMGALPGGQLATLALLEKSAKEDYYLRGVDAGLGREESRILADQVAGPVALLQYVPERIGIATVFRRLPSLNKVADKMPSFLSGRIARMAGRTGVEAATEETQEIIKVIGYDVLNALKEDIPEADWDKHWETFGSRNLEVMISMLPYTGLPAMIRDPNLSNQQRAELSEKMAAATDSELLAVGAKPEAVAKLRSAQGPAERVRAVEGMVNDLDPNSETAKEATEEQEALISRQADLEKEAQRAGAMPGVRITPGKKGFEVYDVDTGESIATTETAEEASEVVWQEMGTRERAGQFRLDALATKLEAGRLVAEEAGETQEIEESKTMTTAQAVAEFAGSDTRIAKELEMFEVRDGGTGGVSRVMTGAEIIDGVSLPAGYRERQEAVTRIYNGSSVFTLIHERSHRKRRELIERGEFTREEQVDLFRRLDVLLDGKTTREVKGTDGETKRPAVPLRFLPEAETVDEVHLDEAFSKLSEVMLMRTINGEKSKLRKLLNDNLKSMVLARVPGASKLMAFVRAMREFFGVNLARASVLRKAEREGKLDREEMDRLSTMILGATPQEEFESDVIDYAEEFVPTDDVPFSIGDAGAIDSLIVEATQRAKKPETRAKIMGEVSRRLQELKREADKIVRAFGRDVTRAAIVDPRTMKSLRKEAAVRQAFRAEELEEEILEKQGGALAMGDAMTLKDMPVHGFIARPGKKMAGGMMESRSAFVKRTGRKPGAEYEGSEGMIGGLLYGGGRSPDQMAQELHEEGIIADPDPSTMWDRLAEERVSVAEMREQFDKALKAVRQARTQAKEEADQWLQEAIKEQKRDHNPVARIRRSLAMLDAVLMALPPELRGRVGGFVQLSKLNSDEKRLEFLQARIGKLDKVVESWLKGEFSKELDKVRKDASVKREGGKKPKGKLGASGHRFFDQVEHVAGMTEGETADHVAALEKQISGAGEKDTIDLAERIQIAHTFGNLAGKSAQEMEVALLAALEVYATKRNAWRVMEEARLGNVRALVAQTVEALGNPDSAAVQISKEKSAKAFHVLKNGAWDIVSFAEVMDNLFGRDSELAKLWSRQAREGFAARTKGITSSHKRWADAIEDATGLKGRAARERVWEMQTKQTVKAIPRPETTSTVKVPIDTFFDAEKRSSLGLTKKEIATLIAQFEASPKGSRKKNLTLTRTAFTPESEATFTESEAVYLSMLWSQEDYKATMTKHGFGEDFQGELEEGLSDAAKDIRQHLATEYADNYEPLRKLFAEMFGVDLPQVDQYTPGKFYSTGEDVTMNAGGEGFVEGGFQQGFLKDRKSHTAEPRAESAFSVYFNHLNQTEHWKALAPLSRDLRGVFGNPKVKKALEARSPEAAAAVNDWLKAIDGNGFNNPPSNKIFEALMTSQAYLALAWKLSTIAKNFFGAAINGTYRMPVKDFVLGYGRLMRGQGSFRKLFESDLIQQRLAGGFAPEVRAAISKAFGSKPTRRAEFLRQGMEVIGLADGIGTAMGAAVTYDYHFRQGLKNGLSRERAEAAAMNEAAETISHTAQPVEITDRSLAELRLHGLGKIAFVFASEARQKSAMWLVAWGNTFKGKATKDDLRVLFVSHFMMAPLMHGIGAALRDARDDDDDEVFDEENWGWEGFAKSVAVGPLSGLPLIRDVFDGFRGGDSGPLRRLVESGESVVDLFTDDPRGEEIEWYERKITKVMQGLDSFTAVSASVFDQVFDLIDNFTDLE